MKTEFDITLEQVKDYAFTVTFDDESLSHITMDEQTPLERIKDRVPLGYLQVPLGTV